MRDLALPRRAVLGAAAALLGRPGDAGARLAWPAARLLRHPGLPSPSETCLSSRWWRPANPQDTRSTLDAVDAFSADRLLWLYTAERAHVSALRAKGLRSVGGTLNSTLPDAPGSLAREKGRVLDRDGKPVTAPWMAAWTGTFWGCANSPDYRRTWIEHAVDALRAGVDSLQCDGETLNWAARQWGGCFCPDCRRIARAEGLDIERQQDELQRRSVLRFHLETRGEIVRRAGVSPLWSANTYPGFVTDWVLDLFDFAIAEIMPPDRNPAAIARILSRAEERGKTQVLTLPDRDVPLNARCIAWIHANGGQMLVPWDVFIPEGDGNDRFFGRAEDFAPLYRFARELGPLLDDVAPVALLPPGSPEIDTDRAEVWGSLRASPDRRFAALHLVPWSESDRPWRISIDAALLGGTRLAGSLRTPGAAPLRLERQGDRLVGQVPPTRWAVIELRPAG